MKRIGMFLLAVVMVVGVVGGCGPQYIGWNSTLVSPPGAKGKAFADDKINVTFDVAKDRVLFALQNKTSQGIKINWDEISITLAGGSSKRIIHEGVRLMDRNAPQALSVVPPNGRLQDALLPSENIYYVSGKHGGWQYSDLFPRYKPTVIGTAEQSLIFQGKGTQTDREIKWDGTTFNIYFPMEIEGSRKEYSFTLRLDSKEMAEKSNR